ncbi:MAG TPA: hypothetical protein VFP26_08050 [Gemmatimonadaceae bacterium]|jgi:hypothetical protein|nr:hypothetical protein [Gemmatimonadaceae bacterium]
MEVFVTFFVILISGMALPIVLFVSGVLFEFLLLIYVGLATIVNRIKKLGRPSVVPQYGVRKIGWAG